MRLIKHQLSFILLGCTFGVVSSTPAADQLRVVELPQAAADFALAPANGAVVAVYADRDEAVIFPRLSAAGVDADARTVKVGRQPVAVVFKQLGDKNYFVVACEEGNELTVIDADTFKVLKSIPVEIPRPSFLSVSRKTDDPFIYYCGGSSTRRGFELGRVHLREFKDLGPISKVGSFPATEVTVSAEGTLLYPRDRNSSPSGFSVLEIAESGDAGRPRLRELYRKHESSEPYYVDPYHQFVVSGKLVYSPDLRQTPRKLTVAPLLVSASRPVLVGVEDDLLSIVSRNTYRVIAVQRLPFKVPRPTGSQAGPGEKNYRQARILEAPKEQALIVCQGSKIAVVPYATLKLEAEPFLMVEVQGPSVFLVGTERSVQLVPKEPKTVLRITKAPEGVTLTGNSLTWKPNASQVGAHTVAIELSSGKRSTPVVLNWRARHPSVELDMQVQALAVDDAGACAVVLEQAGQFGWPNHQANSRVVLVDVKEMKVLGKAVLPSGGNQIAIDAHHIYVGAANADVMYALDRKDLSKSRRVFTSGRVRQFTSVGDRLLFVTTNPGTTTVLRTPSLEQAAAGDIGVGIHSLPRERFAYGPTIPERAWDGWIYEGLIYDNTLTKLRGVAWGQGFWHFTQNGIMPADFPGRLTHDGFGTTRNFTWLDDWAMQAQHANLSRGVQHIGPLRPKDLETFTSEASALLPDFPAAVWVGVAQDGYQPDGGSRWKAALAYCDLISASAQHKLTLLDEPMPFGRTLGHSPVQVVARRGRTVAVVGDQLFAIATPALDKVKFPSPIHAVAPPPLQVVDGKQLKVPLANFTDTGAPLDVVLRKDERGVDIAKSKDHLVLDGGAIIAFMTEKLIADLSKQLVDPLSGERFKTPSERLDAYLKVANVRFEKMVGRKPTGIPLWQPLEITVKNKELQTLDVTFGVLVEVPDGPVREAARRAHEKNQAKPVAPNNNANQRVADLARQQQELQKRVAELEGKLDSMSRKLDLLVDLVKKGKE